MNFRRSVLTVFMAAGFASSAYAEFARETPTLNRKTQNLGMGNIGIALQGSHDSSPFYNPAGLNDLESARYQFFANTIDSSGGGYDMLNEIKDLSDEVSEAPDDATAVRALDDFIQKHAGEFIHFRYTLDLFNYARKNFAAGVMIDERLDTSFRNLAFPNFEMQTLGDLAFYFSGGYGFWDKALQVGASAKPIIRFALDQSDQVITYADVVGDNLDSQLDKLKERRFGISVDLGLKTNLNYFQNVLPAYDYLKPEVGFTWSDVGSPSFGDAVGNSQSIGLGFAVHPDFWILKNSTGIDFRDLNYDREFLSKFHFGWESKFPKMVAVRVGVSQGYFTGGASLDLHYVQLHLAYYGEEIGAKATEDGGYRFAANLSFNI